MKRLRLLVVIVLAAAVCTATNQPTDGPIESPRFPVGTAITPTRPRPHGGSVVFGAEQWPNCVNVVIDCDAGSDWGWWSVYEHVLPRAVQLDPRGNPVASPLLTEVPTLDNGGLSLGTPFRITYHLDPEAVWDDGSPITSKDFLFTWRAIMSTEGSPWQQAFSAIRSIDASRPRTVVIALDRPHSDWFEVFGGSRGFVLEAAAFPRANPRHPSVRHTMLSSIPFSGGPWLLARWSRNVAVLIRNDVYWGPRPLLDQIWFVPRPDQSTELTSFSANDVTAISPVGAEELTYPDLLRKVPGARVIVAGTRFVETYWFSTTVAPLDDPLVRAALEYAIDRETLLRLVEGPSATSDQPTQCGIGESPGTPWCASSPFAGFVYDPAHARALLTEAGWDCSTSPCTKFGEPLTFQYDTGNTSVRRSTIEELAVKQLAAAGFKVVIRGCDCGTLFGTIGCPMNTHAGVQECGVETRPDGSVTSLLSCSAIPSKPNGWKGENKIGWCDAAADPLMREADRELDPVRRGHLLDQIAELEAKDAIGLPLFPIPQLFAWNADELANVTGAYLGTPYGPFFDMDRWSEAA